MGRRFRVLALVLVAALLATAVLPPVRGRLKAGPVLADAVGLAVPRPLAVGVERTAMEVGGAPGELTSPGWAAPGVLLLPGAIRPGLADPRVIQLAEALAGAGRTVFTPELALYDWRLDPEDIRTVRRAADGLAARTGGPVAVLGVSFGGSLALLAAGEQPEDGSIARVAVFGAYFDFTGLIQAATTGVSIVEGERHGWSPDPEIADGLQEVIEQVVAERLDEVAAQVARPVIEELLANDDPARTAPLVAALPAELRQLVTRMSPSSVADRIRVPVRALHARDDPAVPYAEALRLRSGLPHADLISVDLFDHVDLRWTGLLGAAPDLLRSWRFAGWLLGPHEPWLPARLRSLW